jgi:hypothetical protein
MFDFIKHIIRILTARPQRESLLIPVCVEDKRTPGRKRH